MNALGGMVESWAFSVWLDGSEGNLRGITIGQKLRPSSTLAFASKYKYSNPDWTGETWNMASSLYGLSIQATKWMRRCKSIPNLSVAINANTSAATAWMRHRFAAVRKVGWIPIEKIHL